jgi:hypothetical protein
MAKRPLRWRQKALLIIFLPVLLPLTLVALALFVVHRCALYILVWGLWVPRGKDILFVYSDSPVWHEYMTSQILPLVEERAVVLNWSERKKWKKWSLAVQVFHSFGGGYEFNPLILLFHPFRHVRQFRFWSAFKDCKRGYTGPLERVHQELICAL